MTAPEFYTSLLARAFTLSANGEALYVEPRASLTPDECEFIRAHKFELLAILAGAANVQNPDGSYLRYIGCVACGKQAELQQRDGWWFCPHCRAWIKADGDKAVVVKPNVKGDDPVADETKLVLIIAGGRDTHPTATHEAKLDGFRHRIVMMLEGGATGVDEWAKNYADKHGIPRKQNKAKWDDLDVPNARPKQRADGRWFNANAGPDRNELQASEAVRIASELSATPVCLLLPGGSGTADMSRRAAAAGVEVWDWRK